MTTANVFLIASIYALITLGIALVIMGITLKHILPEGNVKNGLKALRRLLLIDGISTFSLTLVAFTIIGIRFILSLQSYAIFSFVLLIIFSTIVLIKTIVKYKIYTIQYSPESKAMHAELEMREIKQDIKDTKKTVAVSAKDIKEVKVNVKIIKDKK